MDEKCVARQSNIEGHLIPEENIFHYPNAQQAVDALVKEEVSGNAGVVPYGTPLCHSFPAAQQAVNALVKEDVLPSPSLKGVNQVIALCQQFRQQFRYCLKFTCFSLQVPGFACTLFD